MNELDRREKEELDQLTDSAGVVGIAKTVERVVWITWWGGTLLIVLSWFSIVSNSVGWLGFALACLSSLTGVIARRYWRVPS